MSFSMHTYSSRSSYKWSNLYYFRFHSLFSYYCLSYFQVSFFSYAFFYRRYLIYSSYLFLRNDFFIYFFGRRFRLFHRFLTSFIWSPRS